MPLFKNLFTVFFPTSCLTCETTLLENETILCTKCRHDLPLLYHTDFKNNRVFNSFAGKVSIEMATAFLAYKKDGKAQQLIHHLKYKDKQEIGTFIGTWFGYELRQSNQFLDIDYIVPVPLHPKKLKKRGYNQLTTFGNSLAKQLTTFYRPDVLLKVSANKTQTKRHRFERFKNAETTFLLSDVAIFKNKHILLIDDVITTGATLTACCQALLKTPNIKISIATVAFTE